MAKGGACFYCRNSINAKINAPGWSYDCKFGIDNSEMNGDVDQVVQCAKGLPRFGFQMGGYYTHMWVEGESDCLEWKIQGNLEFPTDDGEAPLSIHICNFGQIEEFVEFWGRYLRDKGKRDD